MWFVDWRRRCGSDLAVASDARDVIDLFEADAAQGIGGEFIT